MIGWLKVLFLPTCISIWNGRVAVHLWKNKNKWGGGVTFLLSFVIMALTVWLYWRNLHT